MSNLDIFNLDADNFVSKPKKEERDLDFYKPYPENGKDGVYKSLIRFVPNLASPAKSKLQKYYVYLTDPSTGDGFPVDCPSTVGKKSILKDIYWKLKNSHSAADQELAKSFSRKEDYYALIQIVQDKNQPELEGKIMVFKFGKKLNDMLEAQLKPEYGQSCNPFELFEGKLFSVHTRKVGDWNNYDMCSFIGDKCSIEVDGRQMTKTKEDMEAITKYLESGPSNLTDYEYKDWDDNLTERVMGIIRSTVPDGRMINDIVGSANVISAPTTPTTQAKTAPAKVSNTQTSTANSIYEEASSTSVVDKNPRVDTPLVQPTSTETSPSSLDDLYKDL